MAKQWVQIKEFDNRYYTMCNHRFCRKPKLDQFDTCQEHRDIYWKFFDPEFPWDFENNPPELGSWRMKDGL